MVPHQRYSNDGLFLGHGDLGSEIGEEGATRRTRERMVGRHGNGSLESLLVCRACYGIRRLSGYGQYGGGLCLSGLLEMRE